MNDTWKNWLAGQGAVFDGERLLHFGRPGQERRAAVEGSVITDLSHDGLLKVDGEDARTFLQNQFSNDVNAVDEQHAQLNSYSSAKGRLYAIFRLFQWNGPFYLQLPAERLAFMQKRLQMFVLMAKVTLAEAGDETARFGVAGESGAAALRDRAGDLPEAVDAAVNGDDGVKILRLPGDNRYEVHGPPGVLQPWWQAIASHATPAGRDAWPLLDILNGIPGIYEPTGEQFVAQMTNLELIGAVNFKKGCFPGQEVVARMHYRGQAKRRMYRVDMQTEAPPAPGTGIVAVDGDRSRPAGEIVDARPLTDTTCTALAVLPVGSQDKKLHLGDENGPRLTFKALPYSVE